MSDCSRDGATTESSSTLPKTRKKRYCFRPGDDLLLLQTLLDESDLFSFVRSRRVRAWEAITVTLDRQGISATTHSLRCRLKRLVETFQEETAEKKQTAELTALEKLLIKYTEAEAQFLHRKSMARSQEALHEVPKERSTRLSVDSRQSSFDTESEEDLSPTVTTVQPVVLVAAPGAVRVKAKPSIPSGSVESTSENSKKPRKRRFFFEDWHDVLLLKAMLADRGIVLASGARRPAWKLIEASVNSQGLHVNAHTIRTHLRLLVNTHKREEHTWDTDTFELSEKQQLLRAYCKKMDDEELQNREINDDQSFEPALEAATRCVNQSNERRGDAKYLRTVAASAKLAEPIPADASAVSTRNEAVVTSDVVDRQTSEAVSSSPACQSPPSTQTRGIINTSAQSSEEVALSFSVSPASRVTPSSPATEEREVAEPASKRQKLELEAILEGLIADQKERQQEQREHERTRFTEQQDLQRQTIDLQNRALDIQEKAMNMQERLMALMEKVMDKLN